MVGDVKKVYSHAQSLAQCVHWLTLHLPGAPAPEVGRLPGPEEATAQLRRDLRALRALIGHLQVQEALDYAIQVCWGMQHAVDHACDEAGLCMMIDRTQDARAQHWCERQRDETGDHG